MLAEYRGCLDHVTEAAVRAERLGERNRLGWALAKQCLILRLMGRMDDAIEPGRRGLAIAGETADSGLAAFANYALASAYLDRGEFKQAMACCRAAITPITGEVTPDNIGRHHTSEAVARGWLAWALADMGQFGEALVLGREALQIARARENKNAEAIECCLLGGIYLGLGDAAEAVRILEPALDICRAYAVRDWLSPVLMRLGYAYGLVGRIPEGIALLEEGAAHAEAINQMTNFPERLAKFAEVYLLAGRRVEAAETARRAVALAAEQRRPANEAFALRVLGRITADEATLIKAQDLAASLGMRPLVAHCHFELGVVCRNVGKDDQARDHLATAAAMYREMEMPLWLEKLEKLPGG